LPVFPDQRPVSMRIPAALRIFWALSLRHAIHLAPFTQLRVEILRVSKSAHQQDSLSCVSKCSAQCLAASLTHIELASLFHYLLRLLSHQVDNVFDYRLIQVLYVLACVRLSLDYAVGMHALSTYRVRRTEPSSSSYHSELDTPLMIKGPISFVI